jgi:hypothetical protein
MRWSWVIGAPRNTPTMKVATPRLDFAASARSADALAGMSRYTMPAGAGYPFA